LTPDQTPNVLPADKGCGETSPPTDPPPSPQLPGMVGGHPFSSPPIRPTRGGKLVARRLTVAKRVALSFDYLRDLTVPLSGGGGLGSS
jgi:hypothetical protein